MCYFLTIGVRGESATALAAAQQQRLGFIVEPVSNPHLTAIFPKEDKLFWVTCGGCSCELYYLKRESVPVSESKLEAERKQYRKKGWSEAKIARALESKHQKKPEIPRGQREDYPTEQFADFLHKLGRARGGVRVFAHSYTGNVETEKVGKPKTARLTASQLTTDDATLPEDMLIELIGNAG